MPERRMQAKDIPDRDFLEVVRQFNDGDYPEAYRRGGSGDGRWAFVWDVAEIMGIDGNLAEAKAYRLIRRGLMTGCSARHWCRGDYELTDAGRALLNA